ATVRTNQRVLHYTKDNDLVDPSAKIVNSVIIPPCYIGKDTVIENSVIGPHVSIGDNSNIGKSVISNSIIQTNTTIKNANFDNSMIGNFVDYKSDIKEVSIGDYSTQGK
ncbi:MAG: glucose-1-phosphate thymidylyltransferase, partial [Saprospiraceae bacterium]